MKSIIKAAVVCIAVFMVILIAGTSAYGEETGVSDELMTASGADDITNELEPDVQDILSRYGIEAGKPEAADKLGFSETMELITETVKTQASKPVRVFALLIVVVMFTSFLQSMQGGLRGGMTHMSGLVTAIAASAAVMPDICNCFLCQCVAGGAEDPKQHFRRFYKTDGKAVLPAGLLQNLFSGVFALQRR